MFVNQITVFIENKEGRLSEVLEALKEGKINIISLSLADTSDYGLLRLIVSNPEQGAKVLKERGFSAMLTQVLAVKLSHQVGQLQVLLEKICDAGINVEYMYALATGTDDASIIFKTSDLDKAVSVLEAAGVEFIKSKELEG